jgi:hypothetical protein
MKLFNYVLEIRFHAKQSWSHFRIHKHDMHRHLVWGRISATYGQPHLEEVSLCAQCGSPEAREVSCGDEGWTICPDCGTVEGGYTYVTMEEYEELSK